MMSEIYRQLICWFKNSLYADAGSKWVQIPRETQLALCKEAQKYRYAPYLYRMLKGELPPEYEAEFHETYRRQSARALYRQQKLMQLFDLLNSHGLRYCPIKGADLMFNIYPDPVLRPCGDWDILFHPDDCHRVEQVLKAGGWVQPYRFWHKHHFAYLLKDGIMLEPHFRLPNFGVVPMEEIWRETTPAGSGTSGQVRLSPEMNLLMLFRHASGSYWRQVLPHRLLLDTGFLLKKESMNWQKLRALCNRWQFPSPEVLIVAWPEFFPVVLQEQCCAALEQCRDLRWIQEHQISMMTTSPAEFLLMQPDCYSMRWLRERLSGFAPEIMRKKYHIPQGCYWRYPAAYCSDFYHKIKKWLESHGKQRNPMVEEYFRCCARLESRDGK